MTNNIPKYVFKLSGNQKLNNIIKITAGSHASYALDKYGTVWAWGNSIGLGGLGNGSFNGSNNYAQRVLGLNNVIDIKAGQGSCLALKSDGTVWAWGANIWGFLGDGTTLSRNLPVQVKGPNNIGFLTGITAISAKDLSNFAIRNDGTVWAWGINSGGQLGNNSVSGSFITYPVKVKGINGIGYLQDVSKIYAGVNMTVARLDGDCKVVAWGDNNFNTLGYIPQTTVNTPRVLGLSSTTCCSNSRRGINQTDDSSIKQENISTEILAFPNPSKSIFMIKGERNNPFSNYTVKDIKGNIILEGKLKNETTFNINLSKQKDGIYLLNLESKKGNKVLKLIKS